jgi:hypothetical protein
MCLAFPSHVIPFFPFHMSALYTTLAKWMPGTKGARTNQADHLCVKEIKITNEGFGRQRRIEMEKRQGWLII